MFIYVIENVFIIILKYNFTIESFIIFEHSKIYFTPILPYNFQNKKKCMELKCFYFGELNFLLIFLVILRIDF